MVKPQGKTIPIHHDKRTFQQGRHDLIRELEKSHGEKKVQKPKANRQIKQAVATHSNQLSTGQWADQLDRWINETNKWWGHDWNRLWRNMFSLVPVEELDLDPIGTFGVFGSPTYVPSILSRMENQMKALQRNLDQLIPNYAPDLVSRANRGCQGSLLPRGGWGEGMLDYLSDAYEPGEDGKLRFKLRFDLRGYEADDIHVETANNRLTVRAKKISRGENSMQKREFCRTVYLPDKVDEDKFVSNLSEDGILTVEAPLKEEKVGAIKFGRERELGVEPAPETEEKAIVPTGKFGISVLSDGPVSRVHVEIPVEAGFKPEDLHVSTVGNQLVVSGRHEVTEEGDSNDGRSTFVREFQRSYQLPQSVDPLSLGAKMFEERNTLVVEAPLLVKPE
ncbi:Alpha crystallin-containing small heat shock protein variant NtermFhHSP35a [Fasciola hepatica]|uniref:Alpha crystallin-containing small heat shock protein variant NtermFhHSP35a n=1 Tax=Fasciola hepatica TaxID=6192 RepID=A0A4E0R528_FASHE|nr:Alpha crystallin-containing small heat shock protein variant NtermFhHSP35a [Fasciola hepatica]